MAKAIVPVVLKMFAEADASVEGAVKAVTNTIQTAARQSLSAVTLSTETVVKDTVTRAGRALSEARISFISERDLSLARAGLKQLDAGAHELDQSLNKLETRFVGISKAANSNSALKPYEATYTQALALNEVYEQIRVSLINQKKAAEDLAKAPKTDYLQAKDNLDRAKLLTKELVSEAAIIKQAYTQAFGETNKALKELEREASKAVPKPTQAQIKATPSTVSNLEVAVLEQRNRVEQQLARSEDLRKKNAQEILTVETKITDVVNQQAKAKLQAQAQELRSLSQTAAQAREQAQIAQRQVQVDLQKQLSATKASDPNAASLRLVTAQSKITADNLEKDAKRAQTAFSTAFTKISADADKSLKNVATSSGRLSSGLGIFSPLVNQIGGFIDSAITSITGTASSFRTTAGIQIGQALSQGIGQGISEGADFAGAGIDDIIKSFTKLDIPSKQLLANIGTGIVVAAAAGGAALAGLGGITLKIASDFEVLTAKLTTTFKDPTLAVNRFQDALEIAAKTPYNVEQVVSAQVQLSALGQKNIQILRDTVDLASGLNADLARTANEVGKAAAGSLRGYQELRNTLGITQERLKTFGAVVDSQNRLLVANEFQIRKNREALLSLIRTDFGGSADRLSQTLQGRISNLQDEIIKLGGALGSVYIPSAKSAVDVTKSFFEILNQLPQSFKTFAAGAIATGAAVGLMTAGLAATSLALSVMGGATTALLSGPLLAFVGRIPLATLALSGLDLLINKVAIQSIPLLGTNLATAAGPLAILVAAAGLLNTAFIYQQEEAERTGQAILNYSKEVANARRVNIEFKEDLIRVFSFPKDFIKDTDDAATVLEKLNKEFKNRGALSVVQDLELAGISLDAVTDKYVEQSKQLDIQQTKKQTLAKLEGLLQEQIAKTNQALNNKDLSTPVGASNLIGVIKDFEAANPAMTVFTQGLLTIKGTSADTLDQLDKFGGGIQKNINQLGPAVAEYKALTDQIAAVRDALDKVQKPLAKLEAPAKFALKVGDVNLVNDSLKDQEKLLADIEAQINKSGLRPANEKSAFSIEEATKLLSGASDANKILLEGFIKTNDTITDLQAKRFTTQAEQDRIRLQAIEAQEKSALSVTTKAEREKQLAIINSAIEIVRAKAERYQQDIKTYVEIQDALSTEQDKGERFRLQNLLDRNKDRIKAEKEAFDFFIQQKQKANQLEAQLDEEKYSKLKAQLQTFIADTKQIVNGVAPTTTPTRTFLGINGEEITTIDTSLKKFWDAQADRPLTAAEKIKEFQAKLVELANLQKNTNFDQLGDKADEARKSFRDAERELQEGIDKAKLEKSRQFIKNDKTGERQGFQDFKLDVDKNLSEAIDKTQKLEVLEEALDKLRSDAVKSHIRVNDFRAEESKLVKQINDLQTDLNKTIKEQFKDLETLRQNRIKDEIQILELQKEAATGSKRELIENQLKGRRKQEVQAEFLQLKAERDAELAEAVKSGKDKELILDKYAQKQEALVRKAYLDHKKSEDDKLKATLDRFKAEDDALNGYKKSRLGGENSPIISLEELSFRSTLSGFGSEADSRAERLKDHFSSPGDRKVPSYESFRLQFERENNLKLDKNGKPLPSSYDDLKPLEPANIGTQIDATVIIDGASVADKEVVKDAAKLVKKSLVAANKKVKLLAGNDAADLDSASPQSGLDLSFSL